MKIMNDTTSWGLTGIGAAGTLAVVFSLASLPKPLDHDVLNDNAVETLADIENVETKVGQQVPMSYEGSEFEILLQGVSKHITADKAPETCYDYRISRDGETLVTASGFLSVEEDRYGCVID